MKHKTVLMASNIIATIGFFGSFISMFLAIFFPWDVICNVIYVFMGLLILGAGLSYLTEVSNESI